MSRLLLVLGVAVALVATAVPGMADTVDLTTDGSSGTLNGAIFEQFTFGSSGTGTIDAFLRFGGEPDDVTAGVNTQGTLLFQTQNSPRDVVSYTVLPLVNKGGVMHREFTFDINEFQSSPGGIAQSYLSLDTVEIWISDSNSLTTYAGGVLTGATKIYDMDAGGDNTVLLDSALSGSGDGKFDMLLYVQDSLFSGATPYVYIYSEVGGVGTVSMRNYADGDGKQEWGYMVESDDPMDPVPEPTTILLLGAGVGGLAARRRRQRMRAA